MRTASITVALGLAVAGCGAPSAPAASQVAGIFYRAVKQHDGRLACRQLAPETRSELVRDEAGPCDAAILGLDIPERGRVLAVERFGHQVQIRGQGDTVFLAEFPSGWKVVAVACSPQPPQPYDCQVKS